MLLIGLQILLPPARDLNAPESQRIFRERLERCPALDYVHAYTAVVAGVAVAHKAVQPAVLDDCRCLAQAKRKGIHARDVCQQDVLQRV